MKLALRLVLPVLLALAVVAQVRRSSELMRAQHLIYSVERRTLRAVAEIRVIQPTRGASLWLAKPFLSV